MPKGYKVFQQDFLCPATNFVQAVKKNAGMTDIY